MYPNDISALHMVEIQHRALLQRAIENLMFSETLYFDDRVHDIVWMLDKLELEIDIKKIFLYQYLRTAIQNHNMYNVYAMFDYYNKNGHMDITDPLRLTV